MTAPSDTSPPKSARRSERSSSLPPAPELESSSTDPAAPLLFEASWEVCNQVGGIYTVLRSKAPSMVSRWGDRYFLIGPYQHDVAQIELELGPAPPSIAPAVKALLDEGLPVYTGHWLVSGRPNVVLFDIKALRKHLTEIKYYYWKNHNIDLPGNDPLTDDVVLLAEMLRRFLLKVANYVDGERPIIGHFHEWMAGCVIPMLRHQDWPGGIVFTTHATLLGRYLATNHPVFYDHLPFFNPKEEARRFGIAARHDIECAAAHGSHVFTTVSNVTAQECRSLLGRDPDLILPNGLNITRFAALHEFQTLHLEFKERIHQFTVGHFFPSHRFDLDTTIYCYTSGRYEYRNKGMDLTIESLARLNHRLKASNSNATVVFFLVTKAPYRSMNVKTLQSSVMLNELREVSEAITSQISKRLFFAVASAQIPDLNALVDDYWRVRLRRTIRAWESDALPPIVTHDLVDSAKDPVLMQLRQCQLLNRPEDRVKVVYHPDFITATSPLFGMEYEQFVRGCHIGIFPSYYEPWGYTPLESAAMGIPSLTSDLSGFGAYVQESMTDHEENGIYVVPRRYCDFNASADYLCEKLLSFCRMSRRERIAQRNRVEALSVRFDWHHLDQYHEAHELALRRLGE
jgi:glycogen(starch) synthase